MKPGLVSGFVVAGSEQAGHQRPLWVTLRRSPKARSGHRRDDSRSRKALEASVQASSGQVEVRGDELDGPSAFFAQRGGRMHGCDA
jgi:hypothetical protein